MTFTFITSLNLFIIYLLKMKILFAKRIREFTTLQSLVRNMTVNDTNRVLFSSLGTEFWCLLQLDLNFIYQNDLTSYYQLSCMLIFKTLMVKCIQSIWWQLAGLCGPESSDTWPASAKWFGAAHCREVLLHSLWQRRAFRQAHESNRKKWKKV